MKAKKYANFDLKCLSHLTLLFAAFPLRLYYPNKNAHVWQFLFYDLLNFIVFLELFFGNGSLTTTTTTTLKNKLFNIITFFIMIT